MEKALTKSISNGVIDSNLLSLFGSAGGRPKFLSGFLRRIFLSDGTVSIDTTLVGSLLRDLRQFLVLFSKVDIDCTPARQSKSIQAYIDTDRAIPQLPIGMLLEFRREAQSLWPYLLEVERLLESEDLCRHSTGALATRESYNQRFHLSKWSERLQSVWPFWHYARSSIHADMPEIVPPELEPPVKVVLVPKTQKSPRVIAMEPSWNQYAQQGVLTAMTDVLARPKWAYLYYSICWKDQSYNRSLARIAAAEESFATIDLSEASDRISSTLVHALLPPGPLRSVVFASRSRYADVAGSKIKLRKFASMGSSLCFPIETMVFYTIACMGVRKAFNLRRVDPYFEWPIRVYGDDIIVPTESAPDVIRLLEAYGLKVNKAKTFVNGKFKESCGSDWYGTTDVTPVRSRIPLPGAPRHDVSYVSVIEWHNQLIQLGWFATCSLIRETYGLSRFPVKHAHQDNIVGVISYVEYPQFRFNTELQRTEQKCLVVKHKHKPDPLNGYPALEKFFRMRGVEPLLEGHLESDGRPLSLVLKTGWAG
jgi:hypothetical protein